jgi:sterol desaturase/sphingolipid hydroxylase (fatty acid hydroxylase superfamily)
MKTLCLCGLWHCVANKKGELTMKNIYKKWKESSPKKFKDMPSWVLAVLLTLSSFALWALSPVMGITLEYANLVNIYGFPPSSIKLGIIIILAVVLPSLFFSSISWRSGQLLKQRLLQ